jgi:hypothetical protein
MMREKSGIPGHAPLPERCTGVFSEYMGGMI